MPLDLVGGSHVLTVQEQFRRLQGKVEVLERENALLKQELQRMIHAANSNGAIAKALGSVLAAHVAEQHGGVLRVTDAELAVNHHLEQRPVEGGVEIHAEPQPTPVVDVPVSLIEQ